MNQRPAKTFSAPSDGRISLSQLKAFSLEAKRLLEEQDEYEAAFYFEQIADHITRSPEKGLNESVGRILGL